MADRQVDQVSLDALDTFGASLDRRALITSDLIDIIGVIAGVKPAAFAEDGHIPQRLIDDVGLLTLQKTYKDNHSINYYSFDNQTNETLAEAHGATFGYLASHPDESRIVGELLGYPTTATEYFLRCLSGSTPGAAPETGNEDTLHELFEQIIFSPEHLRQEQEAYSQPLENAVREYAPKMYARLKTFYPNSAQ